MATQKFVPRLPIDTCEALFEKLKWDHKQLEADWASPYTTFNFVITAYHLYQDWIEKSGTDEQKNRRNNLPDKGKLLFKMLRDITNATKHWELNEKSQKLQVVKEITGPIIGDWSAFLFNGPIFYVRVGDALPSLPELAGLTINCFKWLLEGEESQDLASLVYQLDVIFHSFTKREQKYLIEDINGSLDGEGN